MADEGVLGFLACPSSERERGCASCFIPSPAKPHVLAFTWTQELLEQLGNFYGGGQNNFDHQACGHLSGGRMDVCDPGIQAAHDPFPDLLRLSCGSG